MYVEHNGHKFILTAAHVFTDENTRVIDVNGEKHAVSQSVPHPKYCPTTSKAFMGGLHFWTDVNDIKVLFLSSYPKMQPATFFPGEISDIADANVYGYGPTLRQNGIFFKCNSDDESRKNIQTQTSILSERIICKTENSEDNITSGFSGGHWFIKIK